jgi:predicted DNA repair protein MutK
MVWVGGGIIVHGLEGYGYPLVGHVIHDYAAAAGEALPVVDGTVEWLASAAGYGVFGLLVGGLMIPLVSWILAPSLKALKSLTA